MTAPVQRRRMRLITAGFFSLSGLIAASWSSRIPDVQQKLGLDDAAWGTVLVSLPIGLVTGILLSGWLVERYGANRIMPVSCIICALLLCLLALAPSRPALMLVLFFVGLARTILNISINTRSVEVQQLYDRPIVSVFHGIWSIACLAAAGIGQVMIILHWLPATHFFVVAAFCIAAAILLGNRSGGKASATGEKRPFLVKPDAYLLKLGLVAFCALLTESAMFDWSISYFEKLVKADKSLVTAGLSSFIVTMSLGRLGGDWLIKRYGELNLLVANGMLMCLGLLLAAAFPFVLPAALGFMLAGLGDSIIIPIAYTMAARSKRMKPSYAIACVSLLGTSGFIISPLIMGSLSEVLGMRWAFAFVGMAAILIAVMAFKIRKQSESLRPAA
ncbi:MAG TPA: MFS transporter [Flavisolibacter sp.]|nr:MFS transporter [Flavisolibacter sp.]